MIIVQTRINRKSGILEFFAEKSGNYLPPKNMWVIIQLHLILKFTLRLCDHIKIEQVEFSHNKIDWSAVVRNISKHLEISIPYKEF